eukprot:gene22699-34758_t
MSAEDGVAASPVSDEGSPTRVTPLELGKVEKIDEDEKNESVKRLSVLATNLLSPRPKTEVEKKARTVRFDTRYLPAECSLDKLTSAKMFHNGGGKTLVSSKKKAAQTGYQIFLPKGGETILIDKEQPFKLILTHNDGERFTFTGAEDIEDYESDDARAHARKNVVTLTPIKKEQLLRIRMDILLDSTERKLQAILLSAGKAPSATALMRLYGLTEAPPELSVTQRVVKPLFSAVCILLFIALLGFFLQPPLENFYQKYRISQEHELVNTARGLVASSEIVRKEFGDPSWASQVLDYHVDLFTKERASFMMPFRRARGSSKKSRTTEWELEGSSRDDDEITVTFKDEFKFGEVYVEAIRQGAGWHIESMKIDLHRKQRDYADTVAEWLVQHVLHAFGSAKIIAIDNGQQYLRVNVEIGHDGDRDGDADNDVNKIIQEQSQL